MISFCILNTISQKMFLEKEIEQELKCRREPCYHVWLPGRGQIRFNCCCHNFGCLRFHKLRQNIHETCRQFHQHYTRAFFVRTSFQRSFYYVHVTRKKLPKQRSYKKFVHKTLMKLRLGHKCSIFLNFKN